MKRLLIRKIARCLDCSYNRVGCWCIYNDKAIKETQYNIIPDFCELSRLEDGKRLLMAEITECEKCPYYCNVVLNAWKSCTHPDTHSYTHDNTLVSLDDNSIPDWCPLESLAPENK